MEKKIGYKYLVNGYEEFEKFALGILALVNHKSLKQGIVVDVKTYDGSNRVKVLTLVECDSFITETMGEIESKEEINLVKLDLSDLKSSVEKEITELEDELHDYNRDYHINYVE